MTSKSWLALLPLVLFLVLFVGSGLWYQSQGVDFAFYQISAPVAILPAIALAIVMAKGNLNKRIETFVNGVGDNTITTMVLIYLLAGAFASVAKAVGGVDATVNFGLSIVPPSLLLPGIFVISAFVATSMGTSMGTIAAIAPIALGVAEAAELSLLLTMGTVIGGAMFGDNLSIISDTTIAATRTQGCDMRDKFKMNFKIALPAALLTLVWLFLQSGNAQINDIKEYDWLKVLPYVAVLGLAIAGVNVMLVLFSGIIFAGVIGLLSIADYSVATWSADIYAGYTGMQEILILSLLIGGLAALMKLQGGLDWLMDIVERTGALFGAKAGSTRAGELSISACVALTNLCTANNTVSILINGSVAKRIAERYNVDPKRSASLLDIFSCVVQGILPYGAQILLAASLAKVSVFSLVGYVQYSWLLGFIAILSIFFAWPKTQTNNSTPA